MEYTIPLQISLDPKSIQDENIWHMLKNWISLFELPEMFRDHSRLKIFYQNFLEYYEEYSKIKDCTKEEYLSIIYFLVKSQDDNYKSLHGKELRLLINTLHKVQISA